MLGLGCNDVSFKLVPSSLRKLLTDHQYPLKTITSWHSLRGDPYPLLKALLEVDLRQPHEPHRINSVRSMRRSCIVPVAGSPPRQENDCYSFSPPAICTNISACTAAPQLGQRLTALRERFRHSAHSVPPATASVVVQRLSQQVLPRPLNSAYCLPPLHPISTGVRGDPAETTLILFFSRREQEPIDAAARTI